MTARKETEQKSSSRWNINLPGKPVVDFGRYVDAEPIEQTDIVVWANLGTHHIPRAEDAPTTLTNLASSYMLLAPYNYFDQDAAVKTSMNAVLMNPKKDGTYEVDEGVPSSKRVMGYEGLVGWREEGEQIGAQTQEYANTLGQSRVVMLWNDAHDDRGHVAWTQGVGVEDLGLEDALRAFLVDSGHGAQCKKRQAMRPFRCRRIESCHHCPACMLSSRLHVPPGPPGIWPTARLIIAAGYSIRKMSFRRPDELRRD